MGERDEAFKVGEVLDISEVVEITALCPNCGKSDIYYWASADYDLEGWEEFTCGDCDTPFQLHFEEYE